MTTVRHRIETIKSPLAGCPGGDFLFSFNNAMTKVIDTNVKYHFVYKTTNLINGKWYIGKHSTNDLNDSYLGSSQHLKSAIKKYGKENFIREILLFCDSEEAAYEKDAELVTMEVVKNPMTYNKMPGGKGGQKMRTDDQLKERSREWREANRERRREYQREYQREYRKRKKLNRTNKNENSYNYHRL